jgi:hypothetical protein
MGDAVVAVVVVVVDRVVVVLVVVVEVVVVCPDVLSDEREPNGTNTTRAASAPIVICAERGQAMNRRPARRTVPPRAGRGLVGL